jgi:hypothetical protein
VRYIWNQPKTASAYCFFLNRYLAAFGGVAVTVFSYHEIPESVGRCIWRRVPFLTTVTVVRSVS